MEETIGISKPCVGTSSDYGFKCETVPDFSYLKGFKNVLAANSAKHVFVYPSNCVHNVAVQISLFHYFDDVVSHSIPKTTKTTWFCSNGVDHFGRPKWRKLIEDKDGIHRYILDFGTRIDVAVDVSKLGRWLYHHGPQWVKSRIVKRFVAKMTYEVKMWYTPKDYLQFDLITSPLPTTCVGSVISRKDFCTIPNYVQIEEAQDYGRREYFWRRDFFRERTSD